MLVVLVFQVHEVEAPGLAVEGLNREVQDLLDYAAFVTAVAQSAAVRNLQHAGRQVNRGHTCPCGRCKGQRKPVTSTGSVRCLSDPERQSKGEGSA